MLGEVGKVSKDPGLDWKLGCYSRCSGETIKGCYGGGRVLTGSDLYFIKISLKSNLFREKIEGVGGQSEGGEKLLRRSWKEESQRGSCIGPRYWQ